MYKALLIILIFAIITAQFIASNIKLLKNPNPSQDFEVFYLSGQQVTSKSNPYLMLGKDIVRNPPPTMLLFMLLPLFPINLSQVILLILSSTTFIIASYFFLKALGGLNWKLWFCYLSLVFVFFPFRYNLGSGQVNNLLFLFLVLAFYFIQRKKEVLSSFFLALSIALKITPAFLLYSLFIQKKFKNILWTILFLILISIATAGITGPHIFSDYLAIPGSFFNFNISTYYNQSFAGFLSRAFNNPQLTMIVILFSLIPASVMLFRSRKNDLILWNLSIIYMLIFAPFAWQYHFVIIIFPLVTTTYLGLKLKLSYKFFILLAFSYLLMGLNLKNPVIFGPVIASHVFFGSLLLLILNYYSAIKLKNN